MTTPSTGEAMIPGGELRHWETPKEEGLRQEEGQG